MPLKPWSVESSLATHFPVTLDQGLLQRPISPFPMQPKLLENMHAVKAIVGIFYSGFLLFKSLKIMLTSISKYTHAGKVYLSCCNLLDDIQRAARTPKLSNLSDIKAIEKKVEIFKDKIIERKKETSIEKIIKLAESFADPKQLEAINIKKQDIFKQNQKLETSKQGITKEIAKQLKEINKINKIEGKLTTSDEAILDYAKSAKLKAERQLKETIKKQNILLQETIKLFDKTAREAIELHRQKFLKLIPQDKIHKDGLAPSPAQKEKNINNKKESDDYNTPEKAIGGLVIIAYIYDFFYKKIKLESYHHPEIRLELRKKISPSIKPSKRLELITKNLKKMKENNYQTSIGRISEEKSNSDSSSKSLKNSQINDFSIKRYFQNEILPTAKKANSQKFKTLNENLYAQDTSVTGKKQAHSSDDSTSIRERSLQLFISLIDVSGTNTGYAEPTWDDFL